MLKDNAFFQDTKQFTPNLGVILPKFIPNMGVTFPKFTPNLGISIFLGE